MNCSRFYQSLKLQTVTDSFHDEAKEDDERYKSDSCKRLDSACLRSVGVKFDAEEDEDGDANMNPVRLVDGRALFNLIALIAGWRGEQGGHGASSTAGDRSWRIEPGWRVDTAN